MSKHLLFYDGLCGLCDHAVQYVLKADKKDLFVFAPLQGKTAAKLLKQLPQEMRGADSLILVENYQQTDKRYFILGKGALRICWDLGGSWALLGVFSFLPSILYNWAYRFVARNRQRFFKNECILPDPKNKHRFLP